MTPLINSQSPEWGWQPVEGASGTHLGEGLLEDSKMAKHVGALGINFRGTKFLRPYRSIPEVRKSNKIHKGKISAREQTEMSKRSWITEGKWHPYSERYVPRTRDMWMWKRTRPGNNLLKRSGIDSLQKGSSGGRLGKFNSEMI